MQNQWFALFLHDRTNNYQTLLGEDAEKTARRYDHGVSIYSADRNAETQVQQIHTVISETKNRRPTALLVSPVRESGLLGVLMEAATQGIPWIFLCRWSDSVHGVRRDHPRYQAFSVAADQGQIGRLQGQLMKRLIGNKRELVYIQGPQGTSSVSRRHAALERELAVVPGLRWSPYNSDWSIEGGAAAARSWLATFRRGKVPEFVVCAQNDDMALGARQAIIEGGHLAPLEELTIVGCDGLPTFGQRLVMEGQLSATVIVPPVSGRAIEELMNARTTQRLVPPEVSVEVQCFPTLERLEKTARTADNPANGARASSKSLANMRRVVPTQRPERRDRDAGPSEESIVAATLKEVAATSRLATSLRSTLRDSPAPRIDTAYRRADTPRRASAGGESLASSRVINRGIPDSASDDKSDPAKGAPTLRPTNSTRR